MFPFSFGRPPNRPPWNSLPQDDEDEPNGIPMVPRNRNGGNQPLGNTNNNNNNNNNIPPTPPPNVIEVNLDEDFILDEQRMDQENARRQQIIRLALLLIFLFFIIDGGNSTGSNPTSNPTPGTTGIPTDQIILPSEDSQDLLTVFQPFRPDTSPNLYRRNNVTGMYRGTWHSEKSYETNHTNYGSFLMQAKTIPILDLPDISFVYGLVRVYEGDQEILQDISYAMQGIAISSLQKLYLFETPYKSERFMISIAHNHNTSYAYDNSQTHSIIQNHGEEESLTILSPKDQLSIKFFVWDPAYGNQTLIPSPYNTNNPDNVNKNITVRSFDLGEHFLSNRFKFFQITRPPVSSTTNTTSASTTTNHTSTSSTPATSSGSPSASSLASGSMNGPNSLTYQQKKKKYNCNLFLEIDTNKNHLHQESVDESSSSSTSLLTPTLVPSFRQLIASSWLNPTYQQEFETIFEDKPTDITSDISSDKTYNNNILITTNNLQSMNFQETEEQRVRRMLHTITSLTTINTTYTAHNIEPDNTIHSNQLTESVAYRRVKPVNQFSGGLYGFIGCNTKLSITATSYELQFSKLRTKVEIYSLLYTVLSLLQIALTVMQLRQLSTPAMIAKLSLLSVLCQSMLDAVICMGHFLLGLAIPQVFFAPFMWIAGIKLLLFSVFQNYIVINIYQSRYSQEIALEGMSGLRTRIIQLHLRFYGVLLFIMMISFLFPSMPILSILTLYSFWWPQIAYSAYKGTKHAITLPYLLGYTILQSFLPLYLLGCPVNILEVLWKYFSPVFESPSEMAMDRLTDQSACYFLIGWLSIQVLLMYLQSIYGPRFFIPKQFLPYKYDYKRPLPPSMRPLHLQPPHNHGSSQNHGSLGSEFGDVETGSLLAGDEHELECVICYNSIHLNVQSNYMITPCDHLFHEECLLQWMHVKLECPVCRSQLPPVDDDDNDQ